MAGRGIKVGFGQRPYNLTAAAGRFGVYFGNNGNKSTANSASPLNRSLVQSTDAVFSLQGSFNVPPQSNGVGFGFGGGGMCVDPLPNGQGGTLYLGAYYNYYGAVTIPTLAQIQAGTAGTASMKYAPVAMPNDINQSSGYFVNGAVLYNGQLYITKNSYYAAYNEQTAVISACSPDLSSIGAANAAEGNYNWPTSGGNKYNTSRFYAGSMGLLPEEWRRYFGGPAFIVAGPGQGTISCNVSNGTSFSTFDPATVAYGAGNTITPYDWMGYANHEPTVWGNPTQGGRPNVMASIAGGVLTINSVLINGITFGVNSYVTNPVNTVAGAVVITAPLSVNPDGTGTYQLSGAATDLPNQKMFVSNTCPNICLAGSTTALPYGGDDFFSTYECAIGGGLIVPNSRSLLVLRMHQYGPHGGGVPEQGNCPGGCSKGSSGTNDPRRMQIDAYDLAEVYSSRQSGNAPDAVMPYATWAFPNYSSIWTTMCQLTTDHGRQGWMCVDYTNNLMYVAAFFGGAQAVIYVYSFAGL